MSYAWTIERLLSTFIGLGIISDGFPIFNETFLKNHFHHVTGNKVNLFFTFVIRIL